MFLQDNTGGGPSLSDLTGALKDSFSKLQDSIFDFEDQVARINRSVLGQGAVYAKDMRVEFAQAAAKSIEFGGTLDDIANVFSSINKSLQSNTMLTDEQLTSFVAIQKSAGITAEEMGTLAESFDTIGIGIDGTIEGIEQMSSKARGLGLNVGTFLQTVGKNLKLVNAYNFKDGVEGFTRMVARAQALRIDMTSVNKLAADLLNPEKAIELAAEFQNLGGAIGALGDPFQLMNMAQNDMEGLQNTIIDAAKSSVMFNKETGKFQISATEMRRLRASADALGMSYEDLANTAVKAAQEQKAMDELRFTNMTDEQKQLVSNLSTLNKQGNLEIKLPGQDKAIELSKLTTEQVESAYSELIKEQEKQGKSSQEIAVDQLSTLEDILKTLRTPAAKLAAGVAGGETYSDISAQAKTVANNVSANLSKLLTEENYNLVRDKIVTGIQSVTDNITWDQGLTPFLNSVKTQVTQGFTEMLNFFGTEFTTTVTTTVQNARRMLPNTGGGGNNNSTTVTPQQPTNTTQTINLSNLNVVHTGTIRLDGLTQVLDVSRMSNDDIRILSERIKQILEPDLLGN